MFFMHVNILNKLLKFILLIIWVAIMPSGLQAQQAMRERDASSVSKDSSRVVLFFAGDVTFANHFKTHVGQRYQYPFARLKWFADADLSMVNLENPLTERGEPRPKKFNFRCPPEYSRILLDGGIDIVTLANNHIFDYSAEGLFDTIAALDSAGIDHVGAGANLAEARKPVIREVKGIKLAFLAYYGLRDHSDSQPARADRPGTAPRRLDYIRQDIESIRERVDFIVVNFHWGREKANKPDPEQIEFAHQVADFGADLIVGHHPHVLQGVERYNNTIIAYSLGNFIFGGHPRTTDYSAILKIMIDTADISNVHAEMIPIQIDYWQPYLADEATADRIMREITEYSSVFNHSIFLLQPDN